MRYKAVFFDFDGTLMDTSKGIINSGRKAMNALGIPIPENAELKKFIGPPLMDCFRITFGVTDRDTLVRLSEKFREFYHETGIFEAEFYPHITEVLEKLKQKGYKLGVASMKRDDVVKRICDVFAVSRFFDYFGGMTDDETDTKAAIIQRGCRFLEISEKDCVLVGDTLIDENGAKTAGVDFIRVGWGFGFLPSDKEAVNDARDILSFV